MKNQDFYEEINQQIVWLENSISKEMSSLAILAEEYKIIEQETNSFLDEYSLRVGGVFSEIYQISGDVEHLNTTEDILDENEITILPEHNNNIVRNIAVKKHIKTIYRKLAKALHPDVVSDSRLSSSVFSDISSSYKENDLTALIRYERKFLSEKEKKHANPVEKLEYLEKQYDSILKESDILKIKKNNMINSPSYHLMQRVKWYKMCGEDLIADIEYKASQTLYKKKKLMQYNNAVITL